MSLSRGTIAVRLPLRRRPLEPHAMKDILLYTLGGLILEEIRADVLMARIVEVMVELLNADTGTIFLLDEHTQELVSLEPLLPREGHIRVPIDQGFAGYVARTGNVVNVPFCPEDVRFWREADARTGYETRSMLAGPIRATSGDVVGVVQFLNKKGGIFTDDDEGALAELVEQVALLLAETTLRSPGQTRALPTLESRDFEPLPLSQQINGLVGHGSAMESLFEGLRRVAPTEAMVLVRGESGTGKGLIARALHVNSRRSTKPFVRVDCTLLPDGLLENELFGHERGAYTGAHGRTDGQVQAAQQGTLFLDEIGDIPLRLQGKLLGLLQERTFTRLGGNRARKADIRIIAATNRDLEALVKAGKFREDLYYRLRVVQLACPPLRARGRDNLLLLLEHFLRRAAKRHNRPRPSISETAMQRLLAHRWPGNVRELEHCIESAVIFADGTINIEHLNFIDLTRDPDAVTGRQREHPFFDEPSLAKMEARYIRFLLDRYDGNRSACARVLGIGRNTLLRKIRSAEEDDG